MGLLEHGGVVLDRQLTAGIKEVLVKESNRRQRQRKKNVRCNAGDENRRNPNWRF